MRSWSTVTAATLLVLVGACGLDDELVGQLGGSRPGATSNGPGDNDWNDKDDVTCSSISDCGPGEACISGVCQMKRCNEVYTSRPPLGAHRYLSVDKELAVLGDQSFIDGFDDATYVGSWVLSGSVVRDVVGGDLTGTRPPALAAAVQGLSAIRVNRGAGIVNDVVLPFEPTSLSAGDVDRDGIEEAVAVGDGQIAVCDVEASSCSTASLSIGSINDVAVADIDSDGYDEVLLLSSGESQSHLYIMNLDGQAPMYVGLSGWTLNMNITRISAGDLDNDGYAEVVLLEDGGGWDWLDDKIHAFNAGTGEYISSMAVNGGSVDVVAGDRDGDGRAAVYVLRGDSVVEHLVFGERTLMRLTEFGVSLGGTTERIAVVDWDDDSTSSHLVGGPELVAGEPVPIAMVILPPTDYALSKGLGRATIGSTTLDSVTESKTISLTVGIFANAGPDFGPAFSLKVSGQLDKEIAVTKTVTTGTLVGRNYTLVGSPGMVGRSMAGVVLSCGCFHRYTYETEDPAMRLGGSGKTVDIYVPVGGQVSLWSLARYNNLVARVGGLPGIQLGSRVGDVDSYPPSPQTLDGRWIDPDDMVFKDLPAVTVSDIGNVTFSQTTRDWESSSIARTTKLGTGATFGVGFTMGGGMSFTGRYQTAYTINVGENTLFSGDVPPILDNMNTPEDEYKAGRYSFKPFIYREHYTDVAGGDASFYVMNYAVSRGDE